MMGDKRMIVQIKNQCRILALLLCSVAIVSCGDPFDHAIHAKPGAADIGNTSEDGSPTYSAVYSILNSNCSFCHNESGAAASTSYHVTGNPSSDYAAIAALTNPDNPDSSALIKKPTGAESHGGGTLLSPDSSEIATIRAWIAAGAQNN